MKALSPLWMINRKLVPSSGIWAILTTSLIKVRHPVQLLVMPLGDLHGI